MYHSGFAMPDKVLHKPELAKKRMMIAKVLETFGHGQCETHLMSRADITPTLPALGHIN